ncbi:MAG: hypothetical protein JXA25_18420 [Anaerolineales bacterium]|nr:hypothetical protein [Anaerolineales bacterium]
MNPETALVRTYRGSSISSTLEEIQRDLGEEALVVSVREIPGGASWEVWKPQEVEVMVIPPADFSDDGFETVSIRQPTEDPSVETARKLVSLVEAHTSGIPEGTRSAATDAEPVAQKEDPACSTLEQMRDYLKSKGLASDFSDRIFQNAASTLSPAHLQNPEVLKRHVKQQLLVMVKAYNSIRLQQDRIVFLIGPRGSGKTTMAAKLAVYFSEDLKKKVTWICADTIRAASINEARVYTDSLGVPLLLAYTPREMVDCIREAEGSDLILVDTPGFNPYLESDVLQVGKFLTAVPGRSTYLLAPASTKEADLIDMAAAFEPFQPDSLILTKLDETGTYGSIFNFASRSGIPLAYFASGPDVFDDLRPANPARLVDALMGDSRFR